MKYRLTPSLERSLICSVVLLTALFSQFSLAQELFVDKKKHFKKLDEVHIAAFNVSFTTSEGKSASTQSRDNFLGSKSSLLVRTEGLTNELMQKITDEVYDDFVAKLEAAGFSVSYFDTAAMADDFVREDVLKIYPNFSEDLSHYQPFTYMTDITVAAKGMPLLSHQDSSTAGWAGKDHGIAPVTVNYLINSGYLEANAKTREDDFFGKIYNNTKVVFHPAIQVFWRSGVEIWPKKNQFGQIKINEHIFAEGVPGELVVAESEELSRRSSATIDLNINPDLYYAGAVQVLKEANTKLVDAMADAR